MAKLLDKKERVYDLKLTNYGHYLLSVGKFKPTYYSFYDDNIIYDSAYINISESQNQTHTRIKEETPYIESLVLFDNVDGRLQTNPTEPPALNIELSIAPRDVIVDGLGLGTPVISPEGDLESPTLTATPVTDTALASEIASRAFVNSPRPPSYFAVDQTPTMLQPRIDIFKFDAAIGDAFLDGRNTNVAPAWKVVVLNGKIDSSTQKYKTNNSSSLNIPQINISSNYKKEIKNINSNLDSSQFSIQSDVFVDDRYIQLTPDTPMIYVDEVNTELLTDNFDVEVFKVNTDTGDTKVLNDLERKFFETKIDQVVNGLMVSPNQLSNDNTELTKKAVEYYFDFVKDKNVDKDTVCKQLQIFNKSSYYIDLDIDCDEVGVENVYNDIYGSEVVPEICQD